MVLQSDLDLELSKVAFGFLNSAHFIGNWVPRVSMRDSIQVYTKRVKAILIYYFITLGAIFILF